MFYHLEIKKLTNCFQGRNSTQAVLTIVFSLSLMYPISGGNPKVFMVDDNNIHYLFYYYMVYAIIMLIYIVRSNIRYIIPLITNILIAAALSVPELLI